MNKPFVSCLCITFNRPHLLNELIYCFLSQDYDNKELIIINDQKNVTYCYNKSPQIKIYNFNERFESVGEKRNHAKTIASKKAKYVFWMDDDDIYYPDFISYLVEQHENFSFYDIIQPKFVHYSVNNKIINYNDRNIGFPTSSFKKEFSDRNKFQPLMFGSDQKYLKGAKIQRLTHNKITSHIRWGMNTYHVSGAYNDIDNKNMQNEVFIKISELGFKEKKERITIVPELLDSTKKYYKKY